MFHSLLQRTVLHWTTEEEIGQMVEEGMDNERAALDTRKCICVLFRILFVYMHVIRTYSTTNTVLHPT